MIRVEVRAVTDKSGRPAVLLQIKDDYWVTLLPEDAVRVAAMLVRVADEVVGA